MRADLQAAKVYAEALFAAAKDQGIAPVIGEQSLELRDALAENPGVVAFFDGPHIPTERKLDLVGRVITGRFERLLSNFVLLLLRHNRVELLAESLKMVHLLVRKDQGYSQAYVRTAKPLDGAQRSALQQTLERFTGLSLQIDWRVDPELLGGVIFQAGDLLIDDSLRGQLQRLRENLMRVPVH